MVLVLFKDGTNVEVSGAFDVIHKPGYLACVDDDGASVASFSPELVMAYTVNSVAAREEPAPFGQSARARHPSTA
jgi:hypothetical protein